MTTATTQTPGNDMLNADAPRDPLLLGGSVAALRRKLLDQPSAPLDKWWPHYLSLSRQQPQWWFSAYSVLAALVTEAEEDRRLARQAMLSFVEKKDEGMTCQEAQFHTHVVGAPLARWAVYYDWLADAELLSKDEDAAMRAALLDFALVFPQQQIQARIRNFDNQILANAFAAASVGYVLGVKRGDSAVARRLFSTGMGWLRTLLAQLPEGGYSHEGSTYNEHVVLPLIALTSQFLQEVTGRDVLTHGVVDGAVPLQRFLDTAWRIIGPSGMLPGWDQYGFQPASVKAGLTLLARRTGDPAPLGAMAEHPMWHRTTLPAWEVDDRLWTLVWWPDAAGDVPEAQYGAWLNPTVGGALQDKPTRTRLFQYWDRCGGVPSSGRAQVDPNAITLEAFDSLLLLDGHGEIGEELVPRPTEVIADYVGRRTIETVQEYLHSSFGAKTSVEKAVRIASDGSVGQSNALVFDDEGWYVPKKPVEGVGEAVHQIGPMQVVRSEARDYYASRYDVKQVTRSSLMVAGKYVLVTDCVESETPHSVAWQAYVRPEAKAQDGRLVINAPELVRCDVIPLQQGQTKLTDAPGYPRGLNSVRYQHRLPAAASHRIDMAMIPQRSAKLAADLTDGWERTGGGGEASGLSLADAYLSDDGREPETARVYTRRFTVDAAMLNGAQLVLSIAVVTPAVRVEVNGQAVSRATESMRGLWEDSSSSLPWFFDVTDALNRGENEVRISTPMHRGETLMGPVQLWAQAEPLGVDAQAQEGRALTVTIGGDADQVLLDNTAGLVAFSDGQTDARYAVRTADGLLLAAEMTTLLSKDLAVQASAPIDWAWSESQVEIKASGGTTVQIEAGDELLSVEFGDVTQVQWRGPAGRVLNLHGAGALGVWVNGQRMAAGEAIVLPQASADASGPGEATSAEAVQALADGHGLAAADALLAALDSEDWRVQMVAADAVGRLGIKAAMPKLLEMFDASEAELPYPPIKMWWTWSKMMHGPGEHGPDPELPRPVGIKRWRVKRAVVTALGRLGDQRAVAPLEKAMARCDDFFPVTSMLGVALGRLGARSSVAVLERHKNHAEVNTRVHAQLALDLIEGRIDRATFEQRVGIS